MNSQKHLWHRWIEEASDLLGVDFASESPDGKRFSFCAPHPKFKYPEFPTLTEVDAQAPLDLLKRLVSPQHPERVRVQRTLSGSFKHWFKSQKNLGAGSLILTQAPFDPELIAVCNTLGFRLEPLSRDPEEIEANPSTLAKAHALVLSNPSRIDGFYYPRESFLRLIEQIRSVQPKIPILSEESLALFSFEQTAPGSLRDWIGKEKPGSLSVVNSLYPAMSPQGPQTSWWEGPESTELMSLDQDTVEPPANEAIVATQAVLAFQSRQGSAIAEFQRKMLAVKIGLRSLADALHPSIARNVLSVPHWPETGFYLRVNARPLLESSKLSIQDWSLELAKRHDLLVVPGSLFADFDCFLLCFAQPLHKLQKATRHLREALEMVAPTQSSVAKKPSFDL